MIWQRQVKGFTLEVLTETKDVVRGRGELQQREARVKAQETGMLQIEQLFILPEYSLWRNSVTWDA